jgi:hypothetical protein
MHETGKNGCRKAPKRAGGRVDFTSTQRASAGLQDSARLAVELEVLQ